MKTRIKILIICILIILISSIVFFSIYELHVNENSLCIFPNSELFDHEVICIGEQPQYQKVTPSLEQLDMVFRHCEQQRIAKATNYTDHDGTPIAIISIGLHYFNETHYIDNNTCKWQELEKYPNSDELCIPGQDYSEEEIKNQTHIYNRDKCMWEEVWDGYSQPFG